MGAYWLFKSLSARSNHQIIIYAIKKGRRAIARRYLKLKVLELLRIPFEVLFVFSHLFLQLFDSALQFRLNSSVTRRGYDFVGIGVFRMLINIDVARVSLIGLFFCDRMWNIWLWIKERIAEIFRKESLFFIFGDSFKGFIINRFAFRERIFWK